MWYGQSLENIERNYGCVAEYNRCMAEREADDCEIEMKRWEYYKANKKKLQDDQDKAIYFHDGRCYECPFYEDVGMTGEEDDVPHGLCGNTKCEHYKERME